MARPVILGNGSLTVGLNELGLVHDFYYPYVGLDNLTTARSLHHKLGVWVDGTFSWVDSDSWSIQVTMDEDAPIGYVNMHSEALQLSITTEDFVDHEYDVFFRNIRVHNHTKTEREVRLFIHQVFQISRAGRADTALFVPDGNYLLDYKGRCALLIYGQSGSGKPFDQYAIGNYGIEGKQGTYRDAEDGELSGNAVEHGGVDSVVRHTFLLQPGAIGTVAYWTVAAHSQFEAQKVHKTMLAAGLETRLYALKKAWHVWFSVSADMLHTLEKPYQTALKKSLLVIKMHIDKHGGIIASADSSIYNYGRDYYSYVWPRDGAYAVWPLIRLGYREEAERFFKFCRDTIAPGGYMMHKYQPDRAIGSTWHPLIHDNHEELPIQEDETASVVYMLGEYYAHTKNDAFVLDLYESLVEPAANFMAGFIDEATGLPHASYDLWEERFATHTYTVALVYQALLVAADFALLANRSHDAETWQKAAQGILDNSTQLHSEATNMLKKSIYLSRDGTLTDNNTVDVSSFYGAMLFGLNEDTKQLDAYARAVQKTLQIYGHPGIPRYENDQYFTTDSSGLGNPWIITTLWMAQYAARNNKSADAKSMVDWVLSTALSTGVLSEQVHPHTDKQLSVSPLVWSHAELVNTIIDMAKLES